MSKNVAVFVDVANLYYSARGQDVDVDYVALLKTATKGRDLIRAYAYSGLDPENENQRKFIDFLNKNGYKVLTKDIRKFGDGRVKANLDIELVVDLFRLADRMDIAVIVSGDGDFAPAIRALQDKGVRCEVISFRPNTSSDLIAVADEFIDIMKIIGIGRGKEALVEKGMSAPEMPAKEVVPEFGFREASPTVAAAALAALREGKDGKSGTDRARGRGRERVHPAAATATAPEEAAAPVAAAETDAEGRRRRRRRGGRGRGRGGRAAVEVASGETGDSGETAGAPASEIGWTEVDDISQIDGLGEMPDLAEEREYTFEEADEATLAELGLLDAGTESPAVTAPEAEAEAEAAAEEEAPMVKPRRRSRSTKAADESAEAAPVEKASPARRSRTRKPAAEGSEAAAATEAGDKAKPQRRARATRAKAAAGDGDKPKPAVRSRSRRAAPQADQAAPPEGEADAEGIWQRFRTARGTRRGS